MARLCPSRHVPLFVRSQIFRAENRRKEIMVIFRQAIKRIIIMIRVSKALRVFAMARQTERELGELMNGLTDRRLGSTRSANCNRLESGTHRTLAGLQKKEPHDDGTEKPWSIQTRRDGPNVRTRLFFNPRYFQYRGHMLSERARRIASKPPLERDRHDIASLRAVLRSLPSFSVFSVELQKALCRVMRYEKFERRRIIIRKGHVGTSMYFICFGSVGVIHDSDADALFSQVDPIILHRGKSFGEMALMTRCKRNATVCCMEVCELMVIDTEDFQALGLSRIVEKEYSQRLSFFTVHALSYKYSLQAVNTLANESKTELVQPENIICQDTNDSIYSFFVLKGAVDIYKMVTLNNSPEFTERLNEKIPGIQCDYIQPQKTYQVCVIVGTLRSGNCFTTREQENRSFTLVSKGASIIKYETEKLKKLEIYKNVEDSTMLIPSDDEICAEFMDRNKWNFWKKAVLNGCVDRIAKSKTKNAFRKSSVRPVSPSRPGTVKFTSSRRPKRVSFENDSSKMIDSVHLPVFNSRIFAQLR